jgi:molybdate transport system substrate-binding protein
MQFSFKQHAAALYAIAALTSSFSIDTMAQEIKLFSAVDVRLAIQEMVPQFEAATGKKIVMKFELNPAVKKQIDEGESFDVVLINPPMIDELVTSGKVSNGSKTGFGRIPMALAIKAGASKPDISTTDGLRRTLLAAASVAYVGDGSSGVYFNGLLEKLGILAQMKDKLRSVAGGQVGAAVVRGDAEIGASPIMAIIATGPSAQVGGLFPAELQSYIDFGVAYSTTTKDAATSKQLIEFLTDPKHDAALKSMGLERLK